jgi:hypothetical protein
MEVVMTAPHNCEVHKIGEISVEDDEHHVTGSTGRIFG